MTSNRSLVLLSVPRAIVHPAARRAGMGGLTPRFAAIAAWCAEFGRELMADFLSEELGAWRQEIRSGTLTTEALQARLSSDSLERAIGRRAAQERGRGVQRAINATGVVLHTGLGRAPLSKAATRRSRLGRSASSWASRCVGLAGWGGVWALTCPCAGTPGFVLLGDRHDEPVSDWRFANAVLT